MTTEIRPPAAHQRPSGKLYLSAIQHNLVDGVWTLVELDTIGTHFTDGIEDVVNHRITPGVAGFYDIKGRIYLRNVVADTRYLVKIQKNGFLPLDTDTRTNVLTEYLSCHCGAHVYLSAADYLTLMARSDAGVDTVDIYPNEDFSWLSVQRVR